jgi:hypothetical protein
MCFLHVTYATDLILDGFITTKVSGEECKFRNYKVRIFYLLFFHFVNYVLTFFSLAQFQNIFILYIADKVNADIVQ